MSVATLNIFNHNNNSNGITIGVSHSYCFYQELSVKSSSTLRQPKQIIPSIPRQHFKAPKNSSLSPIRSQKVMSKTNNNNVNLLQQQPKRPYPLLNTFSSPASIQTVKTLKQRKRKVSFNEKVVVVCTVFEEEEESDTEEISAPRRHSTGETTASNLKSILIQHHPQKEQRLFTTKSLKQFKKLFSS